MISGFVHRIQNSRKRNSKQMQAMERERQRTVEAGSQTQSVGQSAIDRTVTNNRMSKTEERKEEGMLGGRLYTSTERTKIGCSRWLQSSSASDDIDFPPDRSPPPASPPPPQCTGGWSAELLMTERHLPRETLLLRPTMMAENERMIGGSGEKGRQSFRTRDHRLQARRSSKGNTCR